MPPSCLSWLAGPPGLLPLPPWRHAPHLALGPGLTLTCLRPRVPPPQALAACAEMRPPVDISVGGDGDDTGVGAGAARTDFRSVAASVA